MKQIIAELTKPESFAFPWLIKNFYDSDAEFMHVPAGKVKEPAKKIKGHSI